MKKSKPHIFIGSSSEAVENGLVSKFRKCLADFGTPTSWVDVPEFKEGSKSTFDSLLAAANAYDFALFILTPDDDLKIRTKKFKSARDNVWFEVGLFVAAIGPERVFITAQRTEKVEMRIPSDLLGISIRRFIVHGTSETNETVSSVRECCDEFGAQIKKIKFRRLFLGLASQWYFSWERLQFFVGLSAAKITRNRSVIDHWKIVTAARIVSPEFDFEHDPGVVFTSARELPDNVDDDVQFAFTKQELESGGRVIKADAELQARIILVPPETTFNVPHSLAEAIECRCRDVEKVSFTLGDPPKP